MNELISLWDDRETITVGNELEKLYALQDRPLSKEKKALLLDEVSRSGLPAKAVVAGMRKLMTEDLKSVKLSTIIGAGAEALDPREARTIVPCSHCEKAGVVILYDDQFRGFALACTCENGRRLAAAQALVRWNGRPTQTSNGRPLVTVRGASPDLAPTIVE